MSEYQDEKLESMLRSRRTETVAPDLAGRIILQAQTLAAGAKYFAVAGGAPIVRRISFAETGLCASQRIGFGHGAGLQHGAGKWPAQRR